MKDDALVAERDALIQILRQTPSGQAWCHQFSDFIDRVLVALDRELESQFAGIRRPTLVAVGGYGRRQLSPHSDVDLAVIPPEGQDPEGDLVVRTLYRRLHEVIGDRLKLDVDYGYRPVSDAPGLDPKSRTGLLDARLVAGSDLTFKRFMDLYWESFPTGEFVVSKFREREQWLDKTHRSPLVTKPNVRDGAGGLRCIHCRDWVGAAIGTKIPGDIEAQETILRVRNVLHVVAGSKNDALTPDRQLEVAAWLELDPHAMMELVLGAMRSNHAHYQECKERVAEARFMLERGVWSIRGEVRFMGEPEPASAVFGIARASELDLVIPDFPAKVGRVTVGERLLKALAVNEKTVRHLDRCGVLDQILPMLTRCRTLLPDDLSHDYTVFEHTLLTVRALHALDKREDWLGDVYRAFEAKPALIMAALLHDVGKFEDSPRHPQIGAALAKKLADEWRLEARNAQLIEWLVAHHLEMSHFMRFRDIALPETIEAFAAVVPTKRALDALTLLTYADSVAVSGTNWNSMQEALLRELYERMNLHLNEPESINESSWVSWKSDAIPGLTESLPVQELVESLPAHYLLANGPETIRLHAQMLAKLPTQGTQVEIQALRDVGASEIHVVSHDRPGLLARILGVIYALDVSLSSVRAVTGSGKDPFVVDTFTVDYNDKPLPSATAKALLDAFVRCLDADELVEQMLVQAGFDPRRLPTDARLTLIEGTTTIVEVVTDRSRGVGYQICRFFSRQGWEVVSARVGQWAGDSAAAFYVRPGEGANPDPNSLLEAWASEVSSRRFA